VHGESLSFESGTLATAQISPKDFMQRREFVKSLTALGAGLVLNPRHSLAQEPHIAPAPDPDVKRVLVMFKCHFDAGFIDTQTNVVHKYFSQYFPQAIEVAAAANASGKLRYTWTTGSWLLYEYLEQATAPERKAMEAAIQNHQIAWHALPFTWQTEMLDPSMIEGGLAISQALDTRFGRTTTGAKMTDVPGHTRGLVPPLAKHGVKFLDIGVNDASTTADLPPLFLWQDPSGASLPVMYHLGYGGTTRVPQSDLAISIEVRDDNSGPHTAKEIAEIYERLAYSYPKAEITAASLTDIANAVDPHRASLPVFNGEIGDTWIYGVASDPLKIARYREIARLREIWIADQKIQVGDATDLALLRHLLLEVEHTWGTDTKTWLDFDNYKPADLEKMLDTKNYKVVEFSWQEKRNDLLAGVATLPAPLREQADKALESLKLPPPPAPLSGADLAGGQLKHPAEVSDIETTHFVLSLQQHSGCISQLRNKHTGREWCGIDNPLGLFSYQTLSKEDYDRFIASYIVSKADWAFKDFGKPNIERFGAKSKIWSPDRMHLKVEKTAEHNRILINSAIADDLALNSGLAAFPRRMQTEFILPHKEPVIYLTLSLFQKQPTRLPEAMWLTFNPSPPAGRNWTSDDITLHKSGESISPKEIVKNGNRHMHAVTNGFTFKDGENNLTVEPLDAPVIALGERTPLGFSNDPPDLSKGIHSNLFNNAWGTNYIMWYGEDMRFRYVLRP